MVAAQSTPRTPPSISVRYLGNDYVINGGGTGNTFIDAGGNFDNGNYPHHGSRLQH